MKFNNQTIRIAVREWCNNAKTAEEKYGHISNWDVSNVTDMSRLFISAENFNEDIGSWDVSKVTEMERMFCMAAAFNQDIGSWDVSNVTDIQLMFDEAKSFNQDINGWDVSNVTNMNNMFANAEAFDQPIGDWDVSKVTDMHNMFQFATSFNQNIGSWDVCNVTNMNDMFANAEAFDQPIGDWNVSKVECMSNMFDGAKLFNQNISDWNVSKVESVSSMFDGAKSFKQNLSNWSKFLSDNDKNWLKKYFLKTPNNKIENLDSYDSKDKFLKRLKMINDSIDEIEITTESGSITEEFEVNGTWKGHNFIWTAKQTPRSVDVDVDEDLWVDDLEDLISLIDENDIDGLNSNNFNIYVTGHAGGNYEDINVKWEKPLTNDLIQEIEEKGGLEFLFWEGDLSSDCYFENGSIRGITIKINGKNLSYFK